MSWQDNKSAPAFPCHATLNRDTGDLMPRQTANDDFDVLGMTLRDYFAAHAPSLPGFVRDSFVSAGKRGGEMNLKEHAKVCARWAALYADAVLAERKARQS